MNSEAIVQVPSRAQVIREHRQRGGKIAAVFPIHYPRALLEAFGLLPVEVWGPPSVATQEADARLQPYTCGIVRHGLSFLLQGGLDAADFLMVPHGCDSLQGLGSLLIDFVVPRQPVLTLYLPRGARAAGEDFLAGEIQALFEKLRQLTGQSPGASALHEAIEQEQQGIELVRELFRRRRELPLSDLALYRLIRAREYLPAAQFLPMGRRALAQARPHARQGLPIVLSGILPEPMALLDGLSEAGGMVVGDDLVCVGRRLYRALDGSATNPFRRLARMLLSASPDFSNGGPLEERLGAVCRLLEETGARGFIHLGMKFCEPEQFYLPALRQALNLRKIRALFVEEELTGQLSHQLLTRIQAFLENLT